MTTTVVRKAELRAADLIVDAVYEGGRAGNSGDDPLCLLLGVSNQGGFRHLGRRERPNLIVITTSMAEPDWPDHLDPETGLFTYFGDNRRPGRELHSTPRWGNLMLRDLFARAHAQPILRHEVAPVLVFANAGRYRDSRFIGLAVPGAPSMPPTEDLVAVWRHAAGQRFQNYRSIFTILNVARISRAWLSEVQAGNLLTKNAPAEWTSWVNGSPATPLRSTQSSKHRSRIDQGPTSETDKKMVASIHRRFRNDPYLFEECAIQIAEMLLPGIVERDLTRRSRDGGRDAIGKYRIGNDVNGVKVDFALEAKCYAPNTPVTVRDTSRLISRLRHRQFGVLVTTSFVHSQAYQEIVEDQHPILVVSARDIVHILKSASISDEPAVERWLLANFSSESSTRIESRRLG